MNRTKLLRLSYGLANSLTSTRQLSLHPLSLTQVTHFSHLTQFPPAISTKKPNFVDHKLYNLHQHLLYSSKSQSLFVELVLSNDDWSIEIENKLEKLSPIGLTHESVVYTLVKLKENPQKSLDFFRWVCDRKGFDPSYVHFSVLLTSLACKEFIKEFWDVGLEMIGKGVLLDYQGYQSVNEKLRSQKLHKESVQWTKLSRAETDVDDLANEVVGLILGSDWDEGIEGVVKEKLVFPLSRNFVLRLIVKLSIEPLKALKFFEWVGSCEGYEHDSVTYNAMAKVLAKHDFVGEFWQFVKQMKREVFELDIDTYMKSWRHIPSGDAVELFELMMDGPYKPSLQDVTLLLRSIVESDSDPDMTLVYRVVDKFLAAGEIKTKCIYDCIHRAFCKIGNFDEAKKVVQEMRNEGYKADDITYCQEVYGLCKHKRMDEASKLLEQMETAYGCAPSLKTWTLLVQGYCMANQMDQALSCLAKMKDKGVHPDAVTLHVLVHGFVSHNRLLDAYGFLVQMVNKDNLKPRMSTCKTMIEKLAEAGNFDQALDILRMMRQWEYRSYPEPIVRYVSKSGTVDDAKKVLGALSLKANPSTAAYARIIKAFLEEGRYLEAKYLLRDSPPHVYKDPAIREMFSSDQAQSKRLL